MGEFVDVDPLAARLHGPEGCRRCSTPRGRRLAGSSWDLLNGCEVNDDEESIPGDLFDDLFKR